MKKHINLILVILWMIFIFIMSSFDASNSINQSNFIVNIISNIFKVSNVSLLSIIIRKLAHFTEYLILGVLVHKYIIKKNKKYYISIIICIIYAISDELHQILVPGRFCSIYDVLIDTFGSLIGIYIIKKISK